MIEIPFFDRVIHYKKIDSTFSKAKQLVMDREVRGNFLLIADSQTSGKGRGDNSWYSPSGGIWLTAGLYNLPLMSSITLFLALCIARSIEREHPKTSGLVSIKWPNDIYIGEKKVGGILTVSYPGLKYILSGVGLNSNNREFPPELQDQATSISSVTGSEIDSELLIRSIFDLFAENLPDFLENELKNFRSLFETRYSFLTNKKIIIDTEFEEYVGQVRGINNKGALILELQSGILQPLYSGSVKKIIG